MHRRYAHLASNDSASRVAVAPLQARESSTRKIAAPLDSEAILVHQTPAEILLATAWTVLLPPHTQAVQEVLDVVLFLDHLGAHELCLEGVLELSTALGVWHQRYKQPLRVVTECAGVRAPSSPISLFQRVIDVSVEFLSSIAASTRAPSTPILLPLRWIVVTHGSFSSNTRKESSRFMCCSYL